jgi:predicted ATPase
VRFAVFTGGASVRAAETITGAWLDTFDRLVAKNMLVRHQHAHTRTRLGILETIRAYAYERFADSADRDAVYERHYRYYAVLAGSTEPNRRSAAGIASTTSPSSTPTSRISMRAFDGRSTGVTANAHLRWSPSWVGTG